MSLVPGYTDSEDESASEEEETFTKIKAREEPGGNTFGLALGEEKSESEVESLETVTHFENTESSKPVNLPAPECLLVNPFRSASKSGGGKSVFDNNFEMAESSELQKLQKHVKLAPRHEDLKTLNGRKICWSFRKGKCKFGMKCKYAHFTDLVAGECENKVSAPPSWIKPNLQSSAQLFHEQSRNEPLPVEEDQEIRKRKKRPGLSEGLVPSKKVLAMYYRTKDK